MSIKLCCLVNYKFFCHHCNWKMCGPCFDVVSDPFGKPVLEMFASKQAETVYKLHNDLFPTCSEPKLDYEARYH